MRGVRVNRADGAGRRPAPGAARTDPLLGRQVPVRRTPRGELDLELLHDLAAARKPAGRR